MTPTSGGPKPKVFLAYEIGGIRSDILRATYDEVFTNWDREYGTLPAVDADAPKVFARVRGLLRDRCGVFDLTGEKRHEDNGINLNVLLEFGLALGMERPSIPFLYKPVIDHTVMDVRVSDLAGTGFFIYECQSKLREKLAEAEVCFRRKLELGTGP